MRFFKRPPSMGSEMVSLSGGPEPIRIPAQALRDLIAALMPLLAKHGSITLTIGLDIAADGARITTLHPVTVSVPGEGE